MSEREALESGAPSSVATDRTVEPAELPLLTRLNARGVRLVHLADLLALWVIMVGTMLVRQAFNLSENPAAGLWDWPTYSLPLYFLSFAVTSGLFLATFYFGGLYEREPRLGAPPALPRVVRQALAATGLFAILELGATSLVAELGWVSEADRALPMPFPNLIVLFVVGSIAAAGNRRLVHGLRYTREGPPRVLLVGAPDELNTAREHLAERGARARVVGTASGTERLVERVEAEGATEVMLLSGRWLDSLYPTILDELESRGVNVLQRVTAKETLFGLERVRQVGGMPFVQLRLHTLPRSRARFKRLTDFAWLAVLSPFLLLGLAGVTLYLLVVAGRPVLLRQDRIGAGGQLFSMVKFRTMHPNAEEDGSPRLATRDDPRIIPACRWLRATRLDELPQVWNVLRGEMSVVGPRPERPELTQHFEELIPGYEARYEVPPGITGLAQIHGRYHTDPEYKLGYDLQYLVNWSPVLDLEIMARTVWVVLARRV